ncbi:MAG: hypothetical protein E6G97_15790 [Alphaproteobacteria bacterium]|nr:MAG: hypothetical protein E6G97_15790 [Alphaproteobacteria bacterium]
MRFTDAAHLGLMLAALGLTYLVPFELLLLAYVVLGPAHYATEISWLHDRKYFLPQRGIAIGLALVAIAAALIDNAAWFGFVMWSAFVVCVLLAATTTALQGAVLVIAALALTAWMAMQGASLAVLGVLLPTLIHVSLFTMVFMALGAYRSGATVQWVLLACYVAAIALILIAPPSAATIIPSFEKAGQEYFGNVAPALGRLFGIADVRFDTRLVSLLAFVYTYHYLNWFIKAEIIHWNKMSKGRLALVVAASAASTALYFYDYAFGFTVLLALSLAHIVLEFPLNGLALRQLGAAVGTSVAKAVSQRA